MNARRMSLGKVRALVVVALLGALGFSSDDNTSAQQAVDAIGLERE